MPYFPLTTFQEMVLAFFLGLGAFVLLYLAWGSYPKAHPEGREKEPKERDAGGPGVPPAADNPVPPFLLLVYIGLTVWILAYLIIVGLRVKAIG
jgi:hypothetical protein